MGALNLLCLASDGNQLYGYAAAQETDKPDSPFYNILVRSNHNPDSASALSWTLVSSYYDGGTYFLGGEFLCNVDDNAVFTIIATSAKATPASLLELGSKGLRFTPATRTSNIGTWRNVEMPGYDTTWKASFASTLFSIKDLNNVLMHAYLNTTDLSLNVAALNEEGNAIIRGASPWVLDPSPHGALASIGYADNKLFIFGSKQPTSVVTVIPLLSNSTLFPTAPMAVYNATGISNNCTSGMQAFSSQGLNQDLIIGCDSPKNQTTYFFSLRGFTFTPLGSVQNSLLTHSHLATMAPMVSHMTPHAAYMFGSSGLYSVPLSSTPAVNETWARVNVTGPTNVTIASRYGSRTISDPMVPDSSDYRQADQGLIIGASIGGACILFLALVVWFVLHRRKKRRKQHPQDRDESSKDDKKDDNENDTASTESKQTEETFAEGEVKDSTLDDDIPLVLDGKQLIAERFQDDVDSLGGGSMNRYSITNLSRSSFSQVSGDTALSVHPRPQVSITLRPAPSQRSLQYPGAATTVGNPSYTHNLNN
ncbi:hypothetical protein BGZ59_006791 [Podila verticillata]|nr:hypothetical protein BGZ59_006791 [Podila verticillata]KFH63542.1 hypothetical protein MVEG_10951 [Podila verticillata NRRL 6337]